VRGARATHSPDAYASRRRPVLILRIGRLLLVVPSGDRHHVAVTPPGNNRRQAEWNRQARKSQMIVNVSMAVLLALFGATGIAYMIMRQS
jgi:hypothetical protein